MVDYVNSLHGGAPFIRKFQIGNITLSQPGIPVLAPAANAAGVGISTTTSLANAAGVTVDAAATYQTAQQTDGTSAERLVSVIVNPDAIYRALMSGGATEGTALTLRTISTASTTGLTATITGTDFSSPTFDEGAAWAYDGANAGSSINGRYASALRKITSVANGSFTVTVAFDQDTVVGDNFLIAPYWPLQSNALQLTTNLYQADASIAVGTGGAARIFDLEVYGADQDGRTTSKVLFLLDDHIFNVTT